ASPGAALLLARILPGIVARRALPAGRLARLDAMSGVHHGLLAFARRCTVPADVAPGRFRPLPSIMYNSWAPPASLPAGDRTRSLSAGAATGRLHQASHGRPDTERLDTPFDARTVSDLRHGPRGVRGPRRQPHPGASGAYKPDVPGAGPGDLAQ